MDYKIQLRKNEESRISANIDNSISTVPTMHGKYPRTSYVDNGEMEMVSMSLGNSNFQMLAILPDIDRVLMNS